MKIKNIYSNEYFDIEILQNLNQTDSIYNSLIYKILEEGIWKSNRTGVKTLSIFGHQLRFKNVGENFPVLTTKKVYFKSVVGELLWFLSGSTDKNVLINKYKTTIWNEWDAPNPKFPGDMGPIYGSQWVNWNGEGINQLQNVINTLKLNPDDRRMIVSAWNPSKISEMALPPCHWAYQFYSFMHPVLNKRVLHLNFNLRSNDYFLGAPFDIPSYALLLLLVAKEVDMIPGDLIMNIGDAHIYENHLSYILEQLNRESKYKEPEISITENKSIWEYELTDIVLQNYVSHPNWQNVPVAI